MVLTVSKAVESALKIPVKDQEIGLRAPLILKLYEKEILGMGKARDLIGVTRLDSLYMVVERRGNSRLL
jgi:hypothetical protein